MCPPTYSLAHTVSSLVHNFPGSPDPGGRLHPDGFGSAPVRDSARFAGAEPRPVLPRADATARRFRSHRRRRAGLGRRAVYLPVSHDGRLRYTPTIDLAGLPAPSSLGPFAAYVAWVATPSWIPCAGSASRTDARDSPRSTSTSSSSSSRPSRRTRSGAIGPGRAAGGVAKHAAPAARFPSVRTRRDAGRRRRTRARVGRHDRCSRSPVDVDPDAGEPLDAAGRDGAASEVAAVSSWCPEPTRRSPRRGRARS